MQLCMILINQLAWGKPDKYMLANLIFVLSDPKNKLKFKYNFVQKIKIMNVIKTVFKLSTNMTSLSAALGNGI